LASNYRKVTKNFFKQRRKSGLGQETFIRLKKHIVLLVEFGAKVSRELIVAWNYLVPLKVLVLVCKAIAKQDTIKRQFN
jgi:hypothetical protein